MYEFNLIEKIALWLMPVLLAITVHEASHGWMASRLGDSTARSLGRLSLNPIKHVDPVGTILVPGLLLLLPGGVMFGWAKPVPVAWQNLKHPKRDMALVAAAGPGANLIMGIAWALVVKVALFYHGAAIWLTEPLVYMGVAGIFVNAVLFVLNLLPLPPLDGGRVAVGVMPLRLALPFSRIEPYGLFVVIALLVTGLLGKIILPPVYWVQVGLAQLAGIPVSVFEGVLLALI